MQININARFSRKGLGIIDIWSDFETYHEGDLSEDGRFTIITLMTVNSFNEANKIIRRLHMNKYYTKEKDIIDQMNQIVNDLRDAG